MKAARVLAAAALAAIAISFPAEAQSITIDAGEGASLTGRIVQGFLLIGLLTVAPGIVIMCTSFTRIVVVLSLLRTGMGLQGSPPNMVITSLAMFLTFFIMQPHLERSWTEGLRPMIDDEISEEAAMTLMVDPLRDFMEANVRAKDVELFERLAAGDAAGFRTERDGEADAHPWSPRAEEGPAAERLPLRVLVPAFMISELKRAFEIGFLLMIPFLVIDLLVSAILMSMGMMMLPPVMISLPFKIVFFVLVDGWYLVAGSLARSYV